MKIVTLSQNRYRVMTTVINDDELAIDLADRIEGSEVDLQVEVINPHSYDSMTDMIERIESGESGTVDPF